MIDVKAVQRRPAKIQVPLMDMVCGWPMPDHLCPPANLVGEVARLSPGYGPAVWPRWSIRIEVVAGSVQRVAARRLSDHVLGHAGIKDHRADGQAAPGQWRCTAWPSRRWRGCAVAAGMFVPCGRVPAYLKAAHGSQRQLGHRLTWRATEPWCRRSTINKGRRSICAVPTHNC